MRFLGPFKLHISVELPSAKSPLGRSSLQKSVLPLGGGRTPGLSLGHALVYTPISVSQSL